jgi:hypothetical protein
MYVITSPESFRVCLRTSYNIAGYLDRKPGLEYELLVLVLQVGFKYMSKTIKQKR